MNSKLNVYVVDDSVEMLHCMKEEIIKNDRYHVIGSAVNGKCIHELRGKHLDILILDLNYATVKMNLVFCMI